MESLWGWQILLTPGVKHNTGLWLDSTMQQSRYLSIRKFPACGLYIRWKKYISSPFYMTRAIYSCRARIRLTYIISCLIEFHDSIQYLVDCIYLDRSLANSSPIQAYIPPWVSGFPLPFHLDGCCRLLSSCRPHNITSYVGTKQCLQWSRHSYKSTAK